jgi:hypothetical protein
VPEDGEGAIRLINYVSPGKPNTVRISAAAACDNGHLPPGVAECVRARAAQSLDRSWPFLGYTLSPTIIADLGLSVECTEWQAVGVKETLHFGDDCHYVRSGITITVYVGISCHRLEKEDL